MDAEVGGSVGSTEPKVGDPGAVQTIDSGDDEVIISTRPQVPSAKQVQKVLNFGSFEHL